MEVYITCRPDAMALFVILVLAKWNFMMMKAVRCTRKRIKSCIATMDRVDLGNSGGKSALLAVLPVFPMFILFLFFQHAALDNESFVLLTFSSFAFLGVGTLLLLHAGSKETPRRHTIFINAIAFVLIAGILFVANSLGNVPRGGIRQDYYISMRNFTITAESDGLSQYYGSHSEGIFATNYAVGYVHVFPEWSYYLKISCQKPVDLNGTVYAILLLISTPGRFSQGTLSMPVNFIDGEADSIRIDGARVSWGSETPSSHRVRIEGYKIELIVRLDVEGADYGPELNFTVHPPRDERIRVWDCKVDSHLQNTAALLLLGAFAGILCYIPAKSIRPHLVGKFLHN